MTRKPYIIKDAEVGTLVASMLSGGGTETLSRLRGRALLSMDAHDDMDEIFLDMSDSFREKGLLELDKEGDVPMASIYYTLAFILRRLAHEIYRKYIKNGVQRDNERFIRLVSYNEQAPLLMI